MSDIPIHEQAAPTGANALVTVYTVPSGKRATLSTILVCNYASADSTFRLLFCPGGATDATVNRAYYDLPLSTKNTFALTIGPTFKAGTQVRFSSANGQMAVQVFGVEEDAT